MAGRSNSAAARPLAEHLQSPGLRLNEVFGANGKPWEADAAEPEIYVEARG